MLLKLFRTLETAAYLVGSLFVGWFQAMVGGLEAKRDEERRPGFGGVRSAGGEGVTMRELIDK